MNKKYIIKNYVDLANPILGTKILMCSDEFFAPAKRILNSSSPIFKENVFDNHGKWMDGWETRRRRDNGNDFLIIKLGMPGKINLINLDTSYFNGNHPNAAQVEGCFSKNNNLKNAKWIKITKKNKIKPNFINVFKSKSLKTFSHIRLSIFPDGGIARIRLLGSIDLSLQDIAIKSLGDRKGAIVAMDPRNGDVLALVSSPSYDPNEFSSGIDTSIYKLLLSSENKPLVNRALQGKYPPGSTIKPFLGLIALDNEVVALQEEVWCPGWFSLEGHEHRYRDWKKEGHGHTNLNKAIVESCDVFFYQLAYQLGIDQIHKSLSTFGFGASSGVDITGEKSGLLPSREWKKKKNKGAWFPGETLIIGIGQGYSLTTPVQLAAATSVIANKGKLYKPKLVSGISSQGEQGVIMLPNNIQSKIELKKQMMQILISSNRSYVCLNRILVNRPGLKQPHKYYKSQRKKLKNL